MFASVNRSSCSVITLVLPTCGAPSATLPLLLADYEKQLKKGDKIIFAAFGGGFTWGSIYLTWAYNS